MTTKILLLHGPNLNLLGVREPDVYGSMTLDELNTAVNHRFQEVDIEITSKQSNHEGELIDCLHDAREWASGIVMNPGAYTHTSIALRDAISAIELPVVEVHLSNIHVRESFRQHSYISGVVVGVIAGFGWYSYVLGVQALLTRLGVD